MLAAPKVTMLSGHRAKIMVTQELRFPKSEGAQTLASRVETAGASVPATPSGALPATVGAEGAPTGGVVVTAGTPEDFARRNVGVELEVLPAVGADGQIALDLKANITELEGFVEFAPSSAAESEAAFANYQPIFSIRKAGLQGRAKSGQALVFRLGRTKHIETPQADGSVQTTTGETGPDGNRIVLVVVTATELPLAGAVVARAAAPAAAP